MNISNLILHVGSGITRNIPYFRGLGSLYRLFNKTMMRLGARPTVTASMKDDTRILVDLRTNTDLDAYYRGEYDQELLKTVRSIFDPELYFLDIGANIGFYTIAIGNFIRTQSASGHVMAFEPFVGNYNRLLENLKENDLDRYCTAYNFGLSSECTDSLITLREDFLHGSGTGNAAIPTNETIDAKFETAPIRLERLDSIWNNLNGLHKKIDFIKLDIEGHEDFCLRGGQQTINTDRPTILMEVNKAFYIARGVNLDNTFLPLIPERYSILRYSDSRWIRTKSLVDCNVIDNVFLVPMEKLELARYQIFQ